MEYRIRLIGQDYCKFAKGWRESLQGCISAAQDKSVEMVDNGITDVMVSIVDNGKEVYGWEYKPTIREGKPRHDRNTYHGYKLASWVAVCVKGTQDIVGEFDTIAEARMVYKGNGESLCDYDLWWLAAEETNECGDTNVACWGRTREDAVARLKRALKDDYKH